MNERGDVAKAALFQPMEYHVERRALLAHEQHALSARHVIGDEVRDSLRFACAGRTLNDIALAGARSCHGLRLAWIGGQDHIIVAGCRIGLECGPPFVGKQPVEIGI